jgi:nucleotide-binding universal stress UspA family protein
MTPSGHTIPADSGKRQQMSTPVTHHGIAVGVDGSPPSKVAVDWAAREAEMRGLPLALIHAIPSSLTRMWPEVPVPAELREWHELNGHEILRDARQVAEDATKGRNGIEVSSHIVTGNASATLIDLSKEAAMIVVGYRGLGAIERRLLGSVTWGLVHHAHCPVAVIHDEDQLMPTPAIAHLSLWELMVHRRRRRRPRSPSTRRLAAAWNSSQFTRGATTRSPSCLASIGLTWRSKPNRRWPSGWPGGRSAIPT